MDCEAGFITSIPLGRSFLQTRTLCHVRHKSPTNRTRRAYMTVAETTSSSGTSSSKEPDHLEPKKDDFRSKYEWARGKDIPPVAETMSTFLKEFARPIPIVYRSIINEMLMVTHLARVCPMWHYDVIFAFGFNQVFDDFLKFYPNSDEKEKLFRSMAKALHFDPDVIQEDGKAVQNWLDGKNEADVFNIVEQDSNSSPLAATLGFLKSATEYDWYYSRLFGIGLIKIMESVGVDLTNANAEKWADKLNVPKGKFASELATYLSIAERLKQAEQIFAESSAREARKAAERLAEKARKAKEDAGLAESSSAKKGTENIGLPGKETGGIPSPETEI